MQSTILIKLLQSLDKDEFRRFRKFLRSPFFNSNQQILKLYECLYKFYPSFDAPKLTKAQLYKKIFPKEKYQDTRMRNLISDLKILTEEYLIQLQLKRKTFDKEKTLAEAFGERNLFEYFEKKTKKLVAELEGQAQKGIRNYIEKMWLKQNYFYHPLTNKYKAVDFEIQDILEDLDHFFVLGKLQFGSELKMRERIFSKNFQIRFIQESLKESEGFSEENPVFELYKCVFELFDSEKSEEAFENGKRLLPKHFKSISKTDQIAILLNLRNYAIQQINKGLSSFYKDVLDLYKLGLKLEIIIDNEKISEGDFINIVYAGCLGKEFDWTSNFIETYQNYLDEAVREDTRVLSLAALYFHSQAYSKTIDLLSQYHFTQILYEVNARTILVRAWFEQFFTNHDDYDFLMAQLEAFEKFIRRKTIISSQKKAENLNFILSIKKLTTLIYQKKLPNEIVAKMNNHVKGLKALTARKWLEAKINQIEET